MKMRPFGELLDPGTALARLLAVARPVAATETIPLAGALGRVPAGTVRAPRPVPGFARATWDGYALRAADLKGVSPRAPVQLAVVGAVFAETVGAARIGPGTAAAIAAGGALPRGADTVVPFEEVVEGPGRIVLSRPVPRGDRIAAVGSDFPRGARLAAPDRPLGPAALGALASAGFADVTVFRRPRVAVIPNGNELELPGRPLGPGRIYESNRIALGGFLEAAGAVPLLADPVGDRPQEIRRRLLAAGRRADLVLATGGSSVGERDHLPAIFPTIGRPLFHGLAVRPGKPTLAAVGRGTIWVGLPGHPASCLTNAYWLLLPVLGRLAHREGPGTRPAWARLAEPYPLRPGPLATVVPLHVADGWARPTFRDSSAISSLVPANGFVVLPPGHRSLARGDRLEVRLLPEAMAPAAAERAAPAAAHRQTVSSPAR